MPYCLYPYPHKESYTEGLTDIIIGMLGSAKSSRRFRAIVAERKLKRYKERSVSVALSRLHKKGYVDRYGLGWKINGRGKKYVENMALLSYIPSPFIDNAPHNTIISFDIPEKDRVMRNWLRNQIRIFGYKMLQQSLWVGPGPLPRSFLARLEDLNIRQNIKTFRLSA